MELQERIKQAISLAETSPNPTAVLSRVEVFARNKGLSVSKAQLNFADALAEDFHSQLHAKGHVHAHEADCVLYDESLAESAEVVGSTIHKSYNPISKTFVIHKATTQDDGSVVIEGWISTPTPDLEKDVVEPECFQGLALKSYFDRGAPISCNHDTDAYPVGHLQKSVLVRDGVVIQTELHPTDPADFLEGPGEGTGWYGRGVVDGDEPAAAKIKKGHIRAFSWIGNLASYDKLYNGGRRYKAINPLLETTVAAYPVNPNAVMRIAKAGGLEDQTEKEN